MLFKTYANPQAAQAVVKRLLEAGFLQDKIELLTAEYLAENEHMHNRNVERKGTFGDVEPHYHDRNVERQGSFADRESEYHDRNVERQGSFADHESEYHDRNVERQGSFANKSQGAAHITHETLMGSLTSRGLNHHEAETGATELQQGGTLVLIHTDAKNSEADTNRARAILDQQ